MHIKHYTRVFQKVADPLRPGRTVPTPRYVASDGPSLSHAGQLYTADVNGWFDVPQEVGETLCSFRSNGSGFFRVGEVADAVRLGYLDQPDQPDTDAPRRAPGRPRKTETD